MARFFTRERFGIPQVIAVVFLLFFFAQCAWFVAHVPLTQVEGLYVMDGLAELKRVPPMAAKFDEQSRSHLVAMLSVTGLIPEMMVRSEPADPFYLDRRRWLIRAPFLFAGLLLGASLWYVSRRLCGNAAGYAAIALFAFSPGMVARSSLAGPELLGAWGTFGLIFTAIATAHTLYAPRDVILWNWRRILLLGASIALAAGAQWLLAVMLIPALLFMFWAVPHRRLAASIIIFAACVIAAILLDVSVLGRTSALMHSLSASAQIIVRYSVHPTAQFFALLGRFLLDGAPSAAVGFTVALVTWLVWRRTRFFGNNAPLIVLAVLLVIAALLPQATGPAFFFYALPFLIVFTAGVFADLLETRLREIPLALLFALVVGQAVYSIAGLMRLYSGPR